MAHVHIQGNISLTSQQVRSKLTNALVSLITAPACAPERGAQVVDQVELQAPAPAKRTAVFEASQPYEPQEHRTLNIRQQPAGATTCSSLCFGRSPLAWLCLASGAGLSHCRRHGYIHLHSKRANHNRLVFWIGLCTNHLEKT